MTKVVKDENLDRYSHASYNLSFNDLCRKTIVSYYHNMENRIIERLWVRREFF